MEDSFWWWNAALEFRSRNWYGVQEGDKVAWVWGAPQELPYRNSKELLRARVMRQRHLNAFSMTEPGMQAFAAQLVRWQPNMFRAYASAICLFASFLKRQGIRNIRPQLIETTAEKMTDPQRVLLQDVFQCPVADCYTCRELGTIAYQCERGGLHVSETRYLEIVANGMPVAPGELGEVAITSLHQFAMPFIRYKNGDMGIYAREACPCKRGLPLLKEIVGRTADYLVTADGRFVHGGFFAHVFQFRPQVVRYQVYQPDNRHLEVRLVCREGVDSAWQEDIRREIRECFGESIEISIQIVDSIPLTPAGKHRHVISEIKPEFVD